MSSGGKEPQFVEQGLADSSRGQSSKQVQSSTQDKSTDLLKHSGPGTIWYFVLVLFAALTCVFVFLEPGRTKVWTPEFWWIAFFIILITAFLEYAIYYTVINLRIVITIGGFLLFVLICIFSLFGLLNGIFSSLITFSFCITLVRFLVHPVSESYVDLVSISGKYSRTLFPGLNILFPWEKVTLHLNTHEIQWISPAQQMQISSDDDVSLTAVISYQVIPEDASLILQVNHWEERLRELFIAVIQNVATTFSLSDFLTLSQGTHGQSTNSGADTQERWEKFNAFLYREMRDRVVHWGIQINWVRIRDVHLVPHRATLSAVATPDSLSKSRQKDKVQKVRINDIFAQLQDNPTTEDLLNFRQYANSVAKNLVANFSEKFDNSTQLTIGVYGEWGSGKTSFLQMVEQFLQKSDIYPIWFNAWRYDKEDNLWAALMQKILDQATVNGRWYRRAWVRFLIWKDSIRLQDGVWEVLRKIFPVFFKLLLVFVSLYLLIGLDNKTIESFLRQWLPNNSVITAAVQANTLKVIGAFSAAVAAVSGPFSLIGLFKDNLGIDFAKFRGKSSYREHIAFLDEFNKEFEKIVRLLGRGKPLVIIIDDLDRCLPEKAIQVIEATKVFLDIKGCVFLLGLDRGIVEKAIASKYKDIIGTDSESNEGLFRKKPVFYDEYIDKFIQLAIVLPRLAQSTNEDFIKSVSLDEDIKKCASIFSIGLSPNPRKIKRVLRTFLFVRNMIESDIQSLSVEISILAKLVVIQSEMPFVFEAIMENNAIVRELEEYYLIQHKDDASAEGKDAAFFKQVKKYETMYPQLRQLLLARVSEADSFLAIDIFLYMPLLGFLAVVRPLVLPNKVDEGLLIKEYKDVQLGKINNPVTIRAIAERFRALAQDPTASASISFDAARAAENLSLQATKYEKQASIPLEPFSSP